jgi:hypothetical protein
MTDIEQLFTPIKRTDIARAKGFLRWLKAQPFNYHIDDDPTDIPTINEDIGILLQVRVSECFKVLGYPGAWDAYSPESSEELNG